MKFRKYPSAGSRYSCEVYFFINKNVSLKKGIYHYNFLNNSLELIDDYAIKSTPSFLNMENIEEINFAIFITSVFERNIVKYGDRGYRQILIEAGAISQNFSLLATGMKIPLCNYSDTDDILVETMLGIDGSHESLVHTMVSW